MLKQFVDTFVTMFVVLDPVGSIPIFLIATAGLSAADRKKVAFTATLVALIVLMVFLWGAQYVFDEMHIGVPDRGRRHPLHFCRTDDARRPTPGRRPRARAHAAGDCGVPRCHAGDCRT